MPKPATRLFSLIQLLQSEPNQKAADLASELGISVRTLHRYFAMLDEMGIPIYSERGPQGGFSLVRGYRLPPLVFSPEEAAALALGAEMAEEVWGSLYEQPSRSALVKLRNVLPDEQRNEIEWAHRSLVTTGALRPALAGLDTLLVHLRQAVRSRQMVTIRYTGGTDRKSQQRIVDPYALVFRWGWWYVVGYCHLRQDLRSFRLDRIESLEMISDTFPHPGGFDARAFLENEFNALPNYQVRLTFSTTAASIARTNRSQWSNLVEKPDGSILVEFTVPDLEWAVSNVLAYGPIVEVLEPTELRKMVQERAQAIVKNYSKD
jgi:predicted DNA-binding transcriptional regulator YafY